VLDEGSGLVSAIDTAADTVVTSVSVGVGANFMLYDPARNRLYIANPVANTVTFLEASSDALSATVVGVTNPVSVAALPDGTRFYVSSAAVGGGIVTARVTVFNASGGSVQTTIPLTTSPQTCVPGPSELSIAASADSTRVYVGTAMQGMWRLFEPWVIRWFYKCRHLRALRSRTGHRCRKIPCSSWLDRRLNSACLF
jgi:DNA-binding beta-propeller fold protein YncE